MHGHAISGSRKLNRHWQSGNGNKGFELEENLVFFEREIDEREWAASDLPYWINTSLMPSDRGKWLHQSFQNKNPQRNIQGFKQLVILQEGDYKVHWNLETHLIEEFTKDEAKWERIISGDVNNNFGMFGVNMYPPCDTNLIWPTTFARYQKPNGCNVYNGGCDSYIAWKPSRWDDATAYDSDYSIFVRPYRSTTYSNLLSGANTFNLISGMEEPEVILHIGDKAPFKGYKFKDDYDYSLHKRVVKIIEDGEYYAPLIDFLFTYNTSSSFIVTGKIWLERVGEYTDLYEGWKPKIKSAPNNVIIINP